MNHDPFDRQVEAAQEHLHALLARAHAAATPESAMVDEALEELSAALQELSVAGEQLREQNDELLAARGALEAEQQRYHDLFEFAPDSYLVTNAAGVIQQANQAAGDLLRVPSRFLVGKPFVLYVAEADHPAWNTLLDTLQRGEAVQEQGLHLRPRETPIFPAMLTVAAVNDADGQLTGLRWLVRDASDRNRLEDVERELHLLAEAFAAASAALSSTLSVDELLDRILAEVARVVPSEAAEVSLIHAGETTHVLSRSTLSLGQVRAHAGVPISGRGRVVGFLSLDSSDPDRFTHESIVRLRAFANQAAIAIENARLHDEALRHAAELEQTVAERTAELTQREGELETANQSLQNALAQLRQMEQFRRQFITDVSHELRTPLTNVIAYLDLLKRGRPEKHDHYLAVLQREAELMRILIEDLLVMVELDLGNLRLSPAQLDLNQMVANLVRERADLAATRGLTLQTQLAPALPLVMVDAKMVRQVLVNLLLDVAERCARGGVITLRTQWLGEGRPPGQGTDSPSAGTAEVCPGPGAWLTLSFEIGGISAPSSGLRATISRQILEKHGGALTRQDGEMMSVATVWLPVTQGR
ncbi:MAG: GAF domain-containing protein [Chloroflexi bacterium]|nr:GAF domain-containing protein [Chloroflexota bacterium]